MTTIRHFIQIVESAGREGVVKAYHGSTADLSDGLRLPGGKENAIFLSSSPEDAEHWGNVHSVEVQTQGFVTVDYERLADGDPIYDPEIMQRIIGNARERGAKGVIIRNIVNFEHGEPSTTYAVLDPSAIRRVSLTESASRSVPVLYHGTCPENAASLVKHGWAPRAGGQGANMGQPRYLYLSTGREDAIWFAQQKGCDSVVEVRNVPMGHLIVDPEDGFSDSLEAELAGYGGMPGKVALTKPLPASHFRLSGSVSEGAERQTSVEVPFALPSEIEDVDFVGHFDPASRTAHIGSVISQRSGGGRAAVQAFEAWARKHGATRITGEARPESLPFWWKMGFRDRNRGERLVPIWKML